MSNKCDELIKRRTQSVARRAALKKFGVGLLGIALAFSLALPATAAGPDPMTTSIFDPAGDAIFPYDLYGAPVPSYLDIIGASITLRQGVFHFEVQMASDIPANANPGFTPSVNHLGPTVGISTDPRTAGAPFTFFGQTDIYRFNFLVGALYSAADSGVGLPLGWSGFLINVSTFTSVAIPLEIRGNTLVFETSASSLGNPGSFGWAVASECDPVPITNEKNKSAILVDYAPDHGYSRWPALQP